MRSRSRSSARMLHHAQYAVDAEPWVPEAGVGVVDFAFGSRGSTVSGRDLNHDSRFDPLRDVIDFGRSANARRRCAARAGDP